MKKIWTFASNCATGLEDMKHIDEPAQKKGKMAIICGGSWCGTMAAAILLNHFEKVTLIDSDAVILPSNDDFIDPTKFRKNIPQHKYGHLILAFALKVAKKLFPDILLTYQKLGGFVHDFGEVEWNTYGGWIKKEESGCTTITASRPLMETGLRYEMFQKYGERVVFLPNTYVKGLIMKDNAIVGVKIEDESKEKKEIYGDLVVDCTGQSSRGQKWLSKLGLGTPQRKLLSLSLDMPQLSINCQIMDLMFHTASMHITLTHHKQRNMDIS